MLKIKTELAKQGRSQAWLARQIDAHAMTVNRYFTGRIHPPRHRIRAMAMALGFDAEDLIAS